MNSSLLINNSIKLKFTTTYLQTGSQNSRAYPTICCGIRRGARKQLWKGVTMSKEAIHVVQKLKLAKSSTNNDDDDSSNKMDQVFNSNVGRLLNGDLILVLEELRRQNEWELALKVFDYMRKEDTFKCDVSFYSDMILMLGKNGLIEKAEKVFSEIKTEGLEPDARAYTEMIGAYLKCKMMDEAMNMYTMMKDSGCSPDKLTMTILLKNLDKAGEKELVSSVKKDCEKYIEHPESFLEEISKTYPSRRSLEFV